MTDSGLRIDGDRIVNDATDGFVVESEKVDYSSSFGDDVKAALDELFSRRVTSLLGRSGAVVAVAGDYAASAVRNLSGVTGADVRQALETLDAEFTQPVTAVFTRTGAIVSALADYTSGLVTNDSTVTGATVTDALDNIDSDFAALDSDAVANDSTVAGATVTDALNEAQAAPIVFARISHVGGGQYTSSQNIAFSSVNDQSSGLTVNLSAGTVTFDVAGMYLVSSYIRTEISTTSNPLTLGINFRVNGSNVFQFGNIRYSGNVDADLDCPGVHLLRIEAGDVLSLRCSLGTLDLNGTTSASRLHIARLGGI